MNEQGFYKQDENGEWFYAPNAVYAPSYTLLKEEKDSYELPIDGWDWYESDPSITEITE